MSKVMKNTAATLLMLVLSIATACAPAAPTPTPTPEPTPAPVELLATKPEHLEGIWFNPLGVAGGRYYLFGADGTIYGPTLKDAQEKTRWHGKFRFEDGVFYEEESVTCTSIGSYRVYLTIQEGRAVILRFEEIDDSTCLTRSLERRLNYVRVD
jgi:hypothetical protein